jgi:hypothetical protein
MIALDIDTKLDPQTQGTGRLGSILIHAGDTASRRRRTSMIAGATPLVLSAAISSFTFTVPNSAAKAKPVRLPSDTQMER